jgi:hypothetical protein
MESFFTGKKIHSGEILNEQAFVPGMKSTTAYIKPVFRREHNE